ncbi:MAG: TetR/AcrR family transcriptional regulator [Thermodesulfobacteriota bacterium]
MKKSRAEKILEAATELFLTKGYHATSMDEIAARAGYSKRTLYLDYDNKDDLFVTVGAGGLEKLVERLRRVPQDNPTIEEFIDGLLKEVFAFSRENHQYFHVFFSEATPDVIANCPEKLKRRVAGMERAILGMVVAQVDRAKEAKLIANIDSWEAAGIFIGSVTGIVLLSMAGSQTVFSQTKLDSMARKAAGLIWRGLQHQPPEPSPEPAPNPAGEARMQ